ncbi:GFA family protein [Pelagibacterium limicola]|uniref:GFA family protein n=1 Tax=Pelagibacterium limicola TaxID=2791022 RepID=UPI0018B0168C|nr:GFA family protein [Pelagibacterium limicola]
MAGHVYQGSCHCGAVRFSVETALESPAQCNCSRCRRLGWTMQSVPAGKFVLSSGADRLTSYRFNTKAINHTFCSVCGIEAFASGEDGSGNALYMVNVSCLEGASYDSAAVTHWDGASF